MVSKSQMDMMDNLKPDPHKEKDQPMHAYIVCRLVWKSGEMAKRQVIGYTSDGRAEPSTADDEFYYYDTGVPEPRIQLKTNHCSVPGQLLKGNRLYLNGQWNERMGNSNQPSARNAATRMGPGAHHMEAFRRSIERAQRLSEHSVDLHLKGEEEPALLILEMSIEEFDKAAIHLKGMSDDLRLLLEEAKNGKR